MDFDPNLSGSMLALRERQRKVRALTDPRHVPPAQQQQPPAQTAGEGSGHPFRGNQYVSGESGGEGDSETDRAIHEMGYVRDLADPGEAARELRAQAYAHEEANSRTMNEVATAVGGELLGFEFRLKGEDSLERKIGDKVDEGMSIATAQESIGDSLRYTVGLSEEHYTGGTILALNDLEERGWTVRGEPKNYWEKGDAYSGLNVNMVDPDGLKVEVQFHTPTSFDTKNETHLMYEEARKDDTPPERVAELEAAQAAAWEAVPVPPGAENIGELRRAES